MICNRAEGYEGTNKLYNIAQVLSSIVNGQKATNASTHEADESLSARNNHIRSKNANFVDSTSVN